MIADPASLPAAYTLGGECGVSCENLVGVRVVLAPEAAGMLQTPAALTGLLIDS
ncbi:hypothetical protein [Stieleria varia]|uniref:Uncharacterized protein n=1 Tax=Stieleria varia TaxID=2528005 RepID=A0A5C6AYJ0_9BACT|nr:hypothetical protein [Stieleria varia]TWU05115.1 hypothetical protein Pla52n_31610 [Stieleria varia]